MSRMAIDGFCPACGNRSLGVKSFGVRGPTPEVECMHPDCPQPDAVARLVSDREIEHVVDLQESGEWTLRHPLIERINNDLFSCDMHQHLHNDLGNGNGPRQGAGRYRVVYVGHDPVSSYMGAPMLTWESIT